MTNDYKDDHALPNLLIIGAAKCGTTSLHHYLNAHPSIQMSDLKELNFFTEDEIWAKGLQWYESHFTADVPIRGESSTSYTRHPDVAEAARRISRTLSDVRLIYLVRDPIARLQSDYHQFRTAGLESESLADALSRPNNRYLRASRYAAQLEPYLDYVGRDRIYVETQEQLLSDRYGTLSRIFQFLGVDAAVESAAFQRMWNRSAGKGWGYELGWKVRQRGLRLPSAFRWSAQRLQRTRVFGGRSKGARPPAVDDYLRERLTAELRPEVERLRVLTGMKLDGWSV